MIEPIFINHIIFIIKLPVFTVLALKKDILKIKKMSHEEFWLCDYLMIEIDSDL